MSPETLSFYNTFLAFLALVALVAAISLVSYRVFRGPEAAASLGQSAIWMAWVVALVATLG